jgi:hypothetical protein
MASAMSDFVDLTGASGAQYRFRRTSADALPVNAGNLVVASGAPGRLKVLLCATARSLSRAAPTAEEALKAHRSAQLYVRLNVATKVRDAEHDDIVAAVAPEMEARDLG